MHYEYQSLNVYFSWIESLEMKLLWKKNLEKWKLLITKPLEHDGYIMHCTFFVTLLLDHLINNIFEN